MNEDKGRVSSLPDRLTPSLGRKAAWPCTTPQNKKPKNTHETPFLKQQIFQHFVSQTMRKRCNHQIKIFVSSTSYLINHSHFSKLFMCVCAFNVCLEEINYSVSCVTVWLMRQQSKGCEHTCLGFCHEVQI